jgi:hypothetical protein
MDACLDFLWKMMSQTDVSFSWFFASQVRHTLRVGADTALVPLCIS